MVPPRLSAKIQCTRKISPNLLQFGLTLGVTSPIASLLSSLRVSLTVTRYIATMDDLDRDHRNALALARTASARGDADESGSPSSTGRFRRFRRRAGRPSIPPERLLRAALLQLLYSIRSERQFVERLEFRSFPVKKKQSRSRGSAAFRAFLTIQRLMA